MKTYSLKPSNVKKQWIIINASNLILGRLASIIAYRLRGKHKTHFTPHIDCGDNIIVINANKIHLNSATKKYNKTYYWHTGYPGGIKKITATQIFDQGKGENILRRAVKGMLPKGPLGHKQLKNLKVYSGKKYPNNKKIIKFDIANLNPKNSKTREN